MIKILPNVYTATEIATVEKPVTAIVKEALNQEFTFSFSVVVDDSDLAADNTTPVWQTIQTGRTVEADGQLFDVVRVEKMRDQAGAGYVKAECEHISYRLNSKVYEEFTDFGRPTATQAVERVLEDVAGLQVGSIEFTGRTRVNFEDVTAMRALRIIAQEFGGELAYGAVTAGTNKRSVNLLARRGTSNGPNVVAGVNVSGLRDVTDSRDPEEERLKGKITVAELSKATPALSEYVMDLGDTVHVYDPGLGINAYRRIVSYEKDLANPELSNIELSSRLDQLTYEIAGPTRETRINEAEPDEDVDLDDINNRLTYLEGLFLDEEEEEEPGVDMSQSCCDLLKAAVSAQNDALRQLADRTDRLMDQVFPDGLDPEENFPTDEPETDFPVDTQCGIFCFDIDVEGWKDASLFGVRAELWYSVYYRVSEDGGESYGQPILLMRHRFDRVNGIKTGNSRHSALNYTGLEWTAYGRYVPGEYLGSYYAPIDFGQVWRMSYSCTCGDDAATPEEIALLSSFARARAEEEEALIAAIVEQGGTPPPREFPTLNDPYFSSFNQSSLIYSPESWGPVMTQGVANGDRTGDLTGTGDFGRATMRGYQEIDVPTLNF